MNRFIGLLAMAALVGACSPSKAPTAELSAASMDALEAKISSPSPLKYSVRQHDQAARLRPKPFTVSPFSTQDELTPHLDYYGGPLLESVEIYAVYWGNNVDANTTTNIGGWFKSVTTGASPYMQMLQQYNTASQTIGTGSFMGAVVDPNPPMPANAGTPIDDSIIHGEIARLIDTGVLPPNNGHNIYMIYFPPNTLVSHGNEVS
jgi:hypothetical protein